MTYIADLEAKIKAASPYSHPDNASTHVRVKMNWTRPVVWGAPFEIRLCKQDEVYDMPRASAHICLQEGSARKVFKEEI